MRNKETIGKLQSEIIQLYCEGMQPLEIADKTDLGEHTILIILKSALSQLDCSTIGQAAAKYQENFIP